MTTESASTAPAPSQARRTGSGATQRIRDAWKRLSKLPGGKWLFSKMIGRSAPYTGTIGARVEELRPGYARLTLRDRKKVRNHLRSVHAIALMNLAEEATGLAAVFSMDPSLRGIPVHLEMDYVKKARGTITAECEVPILGPETRGEEEFRVELTNEEGEVVARAMARWKIGD